MKIILSRKGFDSSSKYGKVPSPIFPDNRIISLPIPDRDSPTLYKDIIWDGNEPLWQVIETLTKGKIKGSYGAHLDPDLSKKRIKREPGWKPMFGQDNIAQGHLAKQGICKGDLFLFFGLFRDVEEGPHGLSYKKEALSKHVIWGWLEVDEIINVDSCSKAEIPWALSHPHFTPNPKIDKDPLNTVYVASDYLNINGCKESLIPGAGIFTHFSPELCLTRPGSLYVTDWLLPKWFHPLGRKSNLTYHGNMSRWGECTDTDVALKSVSRGQEFVLNCEDYPEAIIWLSTIFNRSMES